MGRNNILGKIKKYLKNPGKILLKLDNIGVLRMQDEKYLKLQFRSMLGQNLNLDKPKTFNEKLQWLKLYDRKPLYCKTSDKYDAKKIVADIIGNKYVIPTYGIYDSFDEIDFGKLPSRFVVKTTHYGGSHGVFLIDDKKKLNKGAMKRELDGIMKKNLYYYSREWPYKNIKPRIIIEEYMNMPEGAVDYKFMCFNGKVKCIFTCTERFDNGLRVTFFDTDWNVLPFERSHPKSTRKIPRPKHLKEMIELSEKIVREIDAPFARIDFYDTKESGVKFGEITLYPGAGLEAFQPEEWDRKLGDWIKLPKDKSKDEK